MEASVQGNGTFRTLVTGLFGPKRFFVLLVTYWIDFVSDIGLYRRKTSQQSTFLVPGLVAPKPSRTWAFRPIFFVRVISYHFSGHLVPSFIMGFNSLMLFFYLSKFTFLNRLLYISKFYHISCNTVLFRLFNSGNPLWLYVCIYTN